MSYQPIDKQGRPKAAFPTTRLDVRDFFFWRSWQGEAVVRTFYYVHIVLALIVLISNIVMYTISLGAGGFFLGLFIGILIAIFMIIFARVICELVLSVFSIRDNMERLATQGAQPQIASVQPPTYAAYQQPPPVVHQQYQAL